MQEESSSSTSEAIFADLYAHVRALEARKERLEMEAADLDRKLRETTEWVHGSASGSTVALGRVVSAPVKAIHSPADLQAFVDGPTCASLIDFVMRLALAAKGKAATPGLSPSKLSKALERAAEVVDEVPAQDKDHPSQRFGNRAFRTWHAQLSFEASALLDDEEMETYFTHCFGDPTRLDFGTGHEVAFVMLMFCLHRREGESFERLALFEFPLYMKVVRKLRQEYRLEPAGSHGVWSLDDYHFVCFILGAAQMIGKPDSPRVVRTVPVVEELAAKGSMYFEGIADILRSKRGPFQEHSPMLYEISSLKSWEDVYEGLLKMWKGEVLAKMPVAQHFYFGVTLPATWSTSPLQGDIITRVDTSIKAQSLPSPFAAGHQATIDPMQRYFGRADKDKTVEYTPRMFEGGLEIAGWTISSASGRISSEQEIDDVRAANPELDFPFPEMFFGHSSLTLQTSALRLVFSPVNALKGCKLPSSGPDRKMFKVNLAEAWSKRRDGDGKPIPTGREDFDWTLTTFYCGDSSQTFRATPRRIDYEHLKQREPILFATEIILYEDDLFDTGVVKLSVKIRVMPTCFFALNRLFLRVDNTFVRVVDARFYHLFGSKTLVRETSLREATFEQLGGNVQSKDLVDANTVANLTPLVGQPKTMECNI